jgi:hypothetical protein
VTGFDPDRGQLFAAPPDEGRGSWAGAPGAFRDGDTLFVSYRLRRPQPTRGYELRIAAVRDGRLEDVWRVRKEEIDAESVERAALVRVGNRWRVYPSYVSRVDRKWRIGLIESSSVDGFDARQVQPALDPDAAGMAAVKDPWLLPEGDRWLMFVSCGRAVTDPFHGSGDALSTGAVRSETGLATSDDGIAWSWEGIALATSPTGWDRSTSRLTAAVRDGGGWLGYYDGAASLAENYEERCGVARSEDLRTWERVSRDGPAVGTPRGPGGVRYVSATERGDIFWEHTREDGSHELRGLVRS